MRWTYLKYKVEILFKGKLRVMFDKDRGIYLVIDAKKIKFIFSKEIINKSFSWT